VIPGLQRREVGVYSFLVFLLLFLVWVVRFRGLEFWELFTSITVEWLVGSCRASELGRGSQSGPLASP
jgi:glucose dehydrogenase